MTRLGFSLQIIEPKKVYFDVQLTVHRDVYETVHRDVHVTVHRDVHVTVHHGKFL
jgi:hypothetical protein